MAKVRPLAAAEEVAAPLLLRLQLLLRLLLRVRLLLLLLLPLPPLLLLSLLQRRKRPQFAVCSRLPRSMFLLRLLAHPNGLRTGG